jgi:hypothetical protein
MTEYLPSRVLAASNQSASSRISGVAAMANLRGSR